MTRQQPRRKAQQLRRPALPLGRGKQAQTEMTGKAEGYRSLDWFIKRQSHERSNRIRLTFTAPGAEPVEMDGAAKATADLDSNFPIVWIAGRIRRVGCLRPEKRDVRRFAQSTTREEASNFRRVAPRLEVTGGQKWRDALPRPGFPEKPACMAALAGLAKPFERQPPLLAGIRKG